MSRYGVTTENPFALLGDDDDEAAEEAEEQVASAAAPKEKPKGAGTTPTPASTTPPGPRGRGRGRGRGGGRRTDAPFREGTYESSEYPGAARASYAGRGPRGGRGRGGPGGRIKRQFDRRDGTGRGHEFEKRHGSGKGNWGVSGEEETEPEEVATGWEMTEEKMEDGPVVDGEVKAEGEEQVVEDEETEKKESAEPPKPEEKPVFTLAEYEAMMKEKMVPVTPVKKEAPAVDKKQFDGMAVLKKSHEESGFEALEVEKIRRRKERREKEVETVEVAFRVGEPIRRGRGRGRGRGRSFDAEREIGEGSHRFSTDGGPSDAPQPDSGGTSVPYVPRGGRGRGHFRGRGAYREHASRGAGRRGIDMASENVFPSLTG